MKTLQEIGLFHHTDKAYDHKFCDFYDYHLSSIRNNNLKILEIGIWKGESLRMWKDYFPNAQVFGIDVMQSALFSEDRIQTFILDQGDETLLKQFKSQYGPFDIVIDDGSHFTYHQFISWNVFSDTPIFIWEDLHTSRMPHYMTFKNQFDEYPLDIAKKLASTEPNCFIFDRDLDEQHVTFIKLNK